MAGRLRQLREQARKTQEEVAGAAGLSVATVHKIETGAVAEPGYFTVLAIVRAIGASIADLAELARHASSYQNALRHCGDLAACSRTTTRAT